MPKPNFVLLCDYAFFSEGGKLNIIGIFKEIFTKTLPLVHTEMFVVTNIFVDVEGHYKETIRLVDENGTNITKSLEFIFSPRKKTELGVVARFNNIKFKTAGNYKVQVYLNDEIAKEIPFTITQLLKPS